MEVTESLRRETSLTNAVGPSSTAAQSNTNMNRQTTAERLIGADYVAVIRDTPPLPI